MKAAGAMINPSMICAPKRAKRSANGAEGAAVAVTVGVGIEKWEESKTSVALLNRSGKLIYISPSSHSINMFARLYRAIQIYRRGITHARTPNAAKILGLLALAYVLFPFDLAPDFIPVLGQLDDIILFITLIMQSFNRIPTDVKHEAERDMKRQEVIDVKAG